ncbi:ATP-grasp domain-containing protein [Methanobacterium oryzae]|uniref:ATP-grasp domain-containing protein n=1 Tax=Methanobacterium oryzae TaxID=69540 RepID=UPI003D1B4309
MKILIIEYATALGIDDPSICAEGHAMVNGLLDDLKDRDIDYLIRKQHTLNNNHCNPVELKGDLMDWLYNNISNYNACLVIAPEEDFILHNITQFIEKEGINIIGSSSNAVMACSDKFKMYESLKNKVPIIETEKVFFDDIDKYNNFNKKKVIKPADGVSCSGVMIITNLEELKKAALMLETNLPYFVIQDFVEGTTASVSLLSNGNEAVPLSLNFQDIQFLEEGINYNGGKVPLNHKLADEAKLAAKKAVESIDGLKGYVGVDMILGEEVNVVEINSRITTPYIALKDILDFNLGEAILDSIYGELPSKFNLNGKIAFIKENNKLKLKKLN